MASTTTTVRGVRLKNELWDDLSKLAKRDRRRVNEYVSIVLENHVQGINNKSKKK